MTASPNDQTTGKEHSEMELLKGLVVLEIGETKKARFCGKLFAEWGADVIKAELPDGGGTSADRAWLDRGKASVVVDWRVPEGLTLLQGLTARADVLIYEFATEQPQLIEFIAQARKEDPKLVVVELSDLGEAGPFASRPATDLIVSALSGMARINGSAGHLPLREPGNQTAIVAAIAGYMGALAALINRNVSDAGQSVQVSALEAMVNVLSPTLLQQSYQGSVARRAKDSGYLFDCADGQVSIIISSERSWETIVELWEIRVDPTDSRLSSEAARRVNMEAVRELLTPVLSTKLRREIFHDMCLVRIPCGMLLSPSELRTDPHLVSRGSMVSVERPDGAVGTVLPGPSFRVAGSQPNSDNRLRRRGEDTARLLILGQAAGATTI
jgi:crotonobetainyl-CoA:carnitine CoA-transferase CaiB-like acyl-CoA transferase